MYLFPFKLVVAKFIFTLCHYFLTSEEAILIHRHCHCHESPVSNDEKSGFISNRQRVKSILDANEIDGMDLKSYMRGTKSHSLVKLHEGYQVAFFSPEALLHNAS